MRRVTEVIIAENFVAGELPKVGTNATADAGFITGATSINILKEDMTELTAADITAAYDGPIHLVRYDRQNDMRLSFKLRKREIKNYDYKVFAAQSFKVVDIAIPATGSIVAGDAYGFYIIDPHDREVVYNGRKLVFVNAKSGETQAQLTQRLVDAVNSYPSDTLNVTASVSGTNVRLTAKPGVKTLEGYERHHSFEVPLYGSLIGATVAIFAPHSLGCGEFEEVYNLENDNDLGYKGHLNRVMYADSPERYANASCDYDMYVIEHNRNEGDTVADNANAGRPLTTLVAFKNGGTGAAAFKAILDGYMGLSLDNVESDAE